MAQESFRVDVEIGGFCPPRPSTCGQKGIVTAVSYSESGSVRGFWSRSRGVGRSAASGARLCTAARSGAVPPGNPEGFLGVHAFPFGLRASKGSLPSALVRGLPWQKLVRYPRPRRARPCSITGAGGRGEDRSQKHSFGLRAFASNLFAGSPAYSRSARSQHVCVMTSSSVRWASTALPNPTTRGMSRLAARAACISP